MNCLYNNALYWGNNGLNDFFCPKKLDFFRTSGTNIRYTPAET